MPISIEFSPRKILLTLVLVIGVLVAASTAAGAAWYFLDLEEAGFLLVQLFWIDSEGNIPSLYAFATLLSAALLLALIARLRRQAEDRYSRHWAVMALVFVYLAFDEGAAIHERTVEPAR